jgi:hypothetical protein
MAPATATIRQAHNGFASLTISTPYHAWRWVGFASESEALVAAIRFAQALGRRLTLVGLV